MKKHHGSVREALIEMFSQMFYWQIVWLKSSPHVQSLYIKYNTASTFINIYPEILDTNIHMTSSLQNQSLTNALDSLHITGFKGLNDVKTNPRSQRKTIHLKTHSFAEVKTGISTQTECSRCKQSSHASTVHRKTSMNRRGRWFKLEEKTTQTSHSLL